MSDKLKAQGKLCLGISTALFNDMGALPPNLVFFCDDKVINLFFDEMSNNAKKYEVAFTAILAAHYLKDVQSIAFSTEAWALDISPETQPELWQKFNGDAEKIQRHIYDKYGDIASSPYKMEMLMIMIDDGVNDYMLRSEILRDGKVVSLNELDSHINDNPKNMDFHQRFNNLLFKSRQLTEAVSMVMDKGSDIFPDKNEDDAIASMLKLIKAKFNIEFNAQAAIASAKRVLKHINNGKTKITLH